MTRVLHDMQLFWFGSEWSVSVVLMCIGMRATEHEVEALLCLHDQQ